MSAYIVGLVMHKSGRWDVVFYGMAVINAITGLLFVCIFREHFRRSKIMLYLCKNA